MERLIRRRWQIALLAAGLVGALVLMYYLRSVFNPFLLALALAYILNPLINGMERRGVPRKSAVVLIFLLMSVLLLATVVLLLPVLAEQARGWYVAFVGEPFRDVNGNGRYDTVSEKETWKDRNGNGVYDPPGAPGSGEGDAYEDLNNNGRLDWEIPADGPWDDINANGVYDKGYIGRLLDRIVGEGGGSVESGGGWLGRFLPRERWAPLVRSALTGLRENVTEFAAGAQVMAANAFARGWAAAGWVWEMLLLLLLTPIYTGFLLYSMNDGWKAFVRHVPAAARPRLLELARKIDIVIGAFFRGRLLVCAAIALFTGVGFAVVGVKFGLILGLAVGAASFIPFLNVFPFAVALLVAWIDHMSLGGLAAMAAVYVVGQGLDPLLMTLVMGKELQLHPVTILLSLFACASLLGFFGMLLAVPIVAVAKILFQEFVLPHLRELAQENLSAGSGPP